MNLNKRKLLTIVTEAVLERQLVKDFKELGVRGYTVVEATGEGSRGVRTGDWEQNRNIRIEIVSGAEVANAIFQHLVDTYYKNYAMIFYLADVEVMRSDKF